MSESEPEAPRPNSSFFVPDATLFDDGRVTIPARHRNRYGLGENDVVDLSFSTPDDAPTTRTVFAFDLVLNDSGSVRIPARKRDIYGLEDGMDLDIEVSLTGMTAPEE